MNKKGYLALMQEYERIIEDKYFNPHFYNKQRLEELKKLINHQLSHHEKICRVEIESQYRSGLFPCNAFELELMEAENMYDPLMQKVEQEESIQGYEYEKCYIEWRYGPFKLKHIMILYLVLGFVMMVRWCLVYFGL